MTSSFSPVRVPALRLICAEHRQELLISSAKLGACLSQLSNASTVIASQVKDKHCEMPLMTLVTSCDHVRMCQYNL